MLGIPRRQTFGSIISSVSSTRPVAAFGTQYTPGQNTKGSWVEVLSSSTVSRDTFGLLVNINSVAVTTANMGTLIDIGVDPAGGTSYSVLVPDLLGSCALGTVGGNAITYFFPVFIKSGSSVAVRGSVDNATVGTGRVAIQLLANPSRPDAIDCGTFVRAIGVTAATSSGTAVTSGSTSEGSWTSLGSTSDRLWYWQLGMGINNGGMANLAYAAELAVGSTQQIIIPDQLWKSGNAETLTNYPALGGYFDVQSGATIYGRLQCSGTPDTGLSMIAYGLG